MARNEGERVTSHVVGSMAPFAGLALSQPLGVIAAFVLFCVFAVAVAVIRGLWATADSWGPFAVLAAIGGVVYACHRWMWTPLAEDPRTPRRITAGILLVLLIVTELCTGRGGIALGKATGWNPEATLMDAGFPVPESIRTAIQVQRNDDEEAGECLTAFNAGNMTKGTARSVNWIMICRRHIPLADQKRACQLLDAQKGNSIENLNEDFCRSIGVWMTSRPGANHSY